MRYEDIAGQQDFHAAATEYVVEVYGQDVLNSFPPIKAMILDCILAGHLEQQAQLEVFIDYRVQPASKERE
ncbi:hypothetical protein EKA85_09000 [Pseudomonas veronii]|uniref:hypothetical protein n=1 Tax=Pseudomonas TaxID=286 RepID=UPI000F8225A4|nr:MULTISPECIES: hypothetical protein [Pseudomonas]MDY7554722.1 hypothetical protein [Pseudomonas sp. FG1]MEB0051481.1 hypothetical protein [Pseudomonas sp. FG1]RTY68683.1 hypothetical protein EKA85_09000 [Pseudomonas veronii]